jgi:hypothetical protein
VVPVLFSASTKEMTELFGGHGFQQMCSPGHTFFATEAYLYFRFKGMGRGKMGDGEVPACGFRPACIYFPVFYNILYHIVIFVLFLNKKGLETDYRFAFLKPQQAIEKYSDGGVL